MRQYTDSFLTPIMGSFSTTDNILTITETGNPARYGILRYQLPISGATQFGVSFLVGYQNADHELLYNTGSMTPNKANVFICNPSNNSILYSRYNMAFDRSMLDAPQLSINIPANNGLQIADLYVILGNNSSLYRDYNSAIMTDEQGQFIGTNDYIVDQYCKVIYERGEFHAAEPHLLTEDMPADVPELFVTGYPDILWRVDGLSNNGKIFSPLIPGLQYNHEYTPVEQKPYITVHNYKTLQSGFDNNGLAVLMPTQCRVTEELNGEYSVYLEHPIDPYGKWIYIMEFNYLKVLGQLFFIYKVTQSYTGAVGKISVWARHVFYSLNDRWIFGAESLISPTNQGIIQAAYNAAQTKPRVGDVNYDYSFSTDLEDSPTVTQYEWRELTAGMTFADFIMGSNGFISNLGGELYRDNFYFSINNRKENSKDDAFELRIGLNMKGVQRTVDTSQLATWVQGQDAYGNRFTMSVSGSNNSTHQIVRELDISDDIAGMEALKKVVQDYFYANNTPRVTWTVNVWDFSQNPDYNMYANMFEYEVGDVGTIFEDRINAFGSISTQKVDVKVTKVVKDGMTGETLEVVFGDKNYITHPKKYRKVNSPEEAKFESELNEIAFYAMIKTPIATKDGELLVTKHNEYLIYDK